MDVVLKLQLYFTICPQTKVWIGYTNVKAEIKSRKSFVSIEITFRLYVISTLITLAQQCKHALQDSYLYGCWANRKGFYMYAQV